MMASSMVTSERRWTSTRKSGMTVLGKVPKPINLPSQKLENHGLDPNVEIVPKGTLTWGSRPSLAASNAWGSSTLSSPKADGSVGSPIYGNGRPSSGGSGGRPSSGGSGARPSSGGSGARPSSGGSGARPSSGGSERSYEPAAIPWGTNSRPSSASGILPTCHMSVAANRPRSAETRPNSSQLSRFAERSGDSIAWGAAGIPEKLASKDSDFTLSSGDFPTLGSEKNYEMKPQPGHTSRGPASASGLYSTRSETSDSQLIGGGNSGHVVHGNFNSWSLDTHPDAGKDASTRMENWHMDHGDMQPQLIENMLPQQFVSLPDSHVHPPNRVWLGGHTTVGPYRPLGLPASYNMDPYYPYIPAVAIPNAQDFPITETIPGGVQLKDGKAYRHMPPESYIMHSQSAIPVRPGVYPGPFLYEGPYGTPRASFDNSKQGVSTVGMQGQYGVHNQHLSENRILESWKFHAQPDGCAPGMIKEQKICGQANETQGQSKVLLKRHDSHEDKDTPAKNHSIAAWLTTQRGKKPDFSTPEGDLLANSYKQEQTSSCQQPAEVAFSKHANDSVHSNITSSLGTSKAGIDNVMKKPNTATTHINDIQRDPSCEKNASMGALNSKSRIADVQFEGENLPAKGKMKSDRISSSDVEDHSNVGLMNTSSTSNTFISHTSSVAVKKLNISTEVISHESFTDLISAAGQSDDQVFVPGKSDSLESGGQSLSHNQNRARDSKARIADVQFEGENLPAKGKMKIDRNSSSDAEDHSNVGLTNTSSTSNTSISHTSNVTAKKLNISKEAISHESFTDLIPSPAQSDDQVFVPGKSDSLESGGHSQSHNQNRVQNIKARVDHHEKLKFGSYGDDEMKCSPKTESLVNISVAAGKSGCELSIPISHASQEAPEVQGTHVIFKSSSEPSSSDSVDHDVQRAKVKEMARQRAIQLQKKEEERTREQKAKALAKLDELNRRTLASSKQNLCHAQNLCNEGLNKQDTASVKDVNGNAVTIEAPCGSLFQDFEVPKQENDDSIKRKGDPVDLLFNLPPRTSKSSFRVSSTQQELSSSLNQDATLEIITGRAAAHLPDSTVSRRKQSNYRRKNMTDDRSQSQKLTNFENTENMKCVSMVPEDASNGLSNLSCEDPPAVQPRKKNNRNPKYKNNLNDTQPNHSLPSSTHLEGISGRSDGESDETKAPARVVEPAAVSEKSLNETMGGKGSIDLIAVPNQAGAEPAKVTSVKANNNWKPRPHRKPVRNVQSIKANAKYQESDTVVWAPVKVVNKNESSEEVQKSSASEVNDLSNRMNGLDMHSGAKARRAEMERYVPKPVSKELSKQGGFLQSSSPSLAPAASPDMIGKLDLASATAGTSRDSNSVVVKTVLAFNYRNTEDTKQNRHAKTRTSWRQRNSGESPSHEQSVLEGSLSFEPPKCIKKTSELQPSIPSDDDWHTEGGNGLQDEPTQLLGVAKNHGISRQRHQQFKPHRVDRSSYAAHNKILQGGVHDKTEIQSPISVGSGERNPSRTENQTTGSDHMRSHWQPKSQVHTQDYLNAYKSSEGVRVTDKLLPSQTTERNHSGSDSGQRNNIIEANDAKHQEGNMERQFMTNHTKNQEVTREKRDMTQPLKSKIQSQEQELAIPMQSVSANSNREQHGLHQHAHYRGRFPRGRVGTDGGSKGIRWSGDHRNDDQQFEYHKSACYYKPGDAFQQNLSGSEEAPEAHRVSSSGGRYGERDRNPARRGGHFYGPHVRVSGAYNDRE